MTLKVLRLGVMMLVLLGTGINTSAYSARSESPQPGLMGAGSAKSDNPKAIKESKSGANYVTYLLGIGDRLKIMVFGQSDLSGNFIINGSGVISFPLIGEVSGTGSTLRELENLIVEKLKDGYLVNPMVSIEVLNFRPYYILGEVAKSGSYSYVNGITVLKAVIVAGGFSVRAKKDKVIIIRATDAERKKQLVALETLIMPGDIIEIRERFF